MKLKRYKKNPIIKPVKKHKWESKATFNCGVTYDGNKFHMLYRAIGEYKNYISRIGYAESSDGINFIRKSYPILKPDRSYEKWGMEDPRITKIDDQFLITYVALHKNALRDGGGIPKTALVSTKDFIHFKKHGVITSFGTNDRDVVIFPERINGKYVRLDRPLWTKETISIDNKKLYLKTKFGKIKWPLEEKPKYFPKKPSIWISYSNDLKNWFGYKVLMEPIEKWESRQIGPGPVPIKTNKGWLLIYHGVHLHQEKCVYGYSSGIYSAGVCLLNLKDPSKIIARSKKPILNPHEKYELDGDVNNVVFPTGLAVKNNKMFVYYGAADKTICLATTDLDKFLESLINQ